MAMLSKSFTVLTAGVRAVLAQTQKVEKAITYEETFLSSNWISY